MSKVLGERIEDTIWQVLEAQAENTGGYLERFNGTIEGGGFSIAEVAEELIERLGLVAEL